MSAPFHESAAVGLDQNDLQSSNGAGGEDSSSCKASCSMDPLQEPASVPTDALTVSNDPQGKGADIEVEAEGSDHDIAGNSDLQQQTEGMDTDPNEDPVNIETEAQAVEARETANQLMKDGEFEKGIDLYSVICKYYVRTYGPHAEECALHYYDYGEALLYQIQETPANIEGEETDDGEVAGNATLSLEALELAKQLYTQRVEKLIAKNTTGDVLKEEELMLATVHCKLGDLLLEQDSFPLALEDYLACAQLRSKYLEPGDRHLAEVYYQLGLTYENLGARDESLEYFKKAHASLGLKPEHADLAEDVARKVEDIEEECRQTRAEEEKVKGMLKEVIGGLIPSVASENGPSALLPLHKVTPLFLQSQSVPQLRALAAANAVDIAECCEKADLIECILKAAKECPLTTEPPNETTNPPEAQASSAAPSRSSDEAMPPAPESRPSMLMPRKRVRPTNETMDPEEPQASRIRVDNAVV